MVAAAGGAIAEPVLLYDVPFSTPPHTVGQTPVIGWGDGPRATPSRLNFGTPTVVNAFGGLVDQPVWMEPGLHSDPYDQLEFKLTGERGFDTSYAGYTLSMDLEIAALGPDQLNDNMAILFDTPAVRRIDFTPDGLIQYWLPFHLAETIGTFDFNDVIHLSVDVDLLSDTWTIDVNGQQLHEGDFEASALESIRVSLGGRDSLAAIDNVVVKGVPSPGAVHWAALGLVLGAVRRRRAAR
jgi:hypothetical protein